VHHDVRLSRLRSSGASHRLPAGVPCLLPGLRLNYSPVTNPKPRILTGDTPTGRLHLGHYVGSIENRLALQDEYDCYFHIANKHAFTTRAEQPTDIRQSVIDVATDWLAVGIDSNRSTMFIQSEEAEQRDAKDANTLPWRCGR
jgi:hypothetical protein